MVVEIIDAQGKTQSDLFGAAQITAKYENRFFGRHFGDVCPRLAGRARIRAPRQFDHDDTVCGDIDRIAQHRALALVHLGETLAFDKARDSATGQTVDAPGCGIKRACFGHENGQHASRFFDLVNVGRDESRGQRSCHLHGPLKLWFSYC